MIDWDAVEARDWQNCKDGKQAEFLVERQFAWKLVVQIGVYSHEIYRKSNAALQSGAHKPRIEIRRDWYY